MKRYLQKIATSLLCPLILLSSLVIPLPVNAQTIENQNESQTFIDKGSNWNYMDDGSDQGTAWQGTDFNDSTWKAGDAPLGFKYDVKTQVSYGQDSNNKYITTYFRKDFDVEDTSAVKTLKHQHF
jgi:hypothetical protein